jgi:hypothetical protein
MKAWIRAQRSVLKELKGKWLIAFKKKEKKKLIGLKKTLAKF